MTNTPHTTLPPSGGIKGGYSLYKQGVLSDSGTFVTRGFTCFHGQAEHLFRDW